MKKYIIWCLLFGLLGCNKATLVSENDAGTFVSVTKQQTAFNEPLIVKVETTKGEFMLFRCIVSGLRGEQCFVRRFSDGTAYFYIGESRGYQIAD